jgi:hypothetical protein
VYKEKETFFGKQIGVSWGRIIVSFTPPQLTQQKQPRVFGKKKYKNKKAFRAKKSTHLASSSSTCFLSSSSSHLAA